MTITSIVQDPGTPRQLIVTFDGDITAADFDVDWLTCDSGAGPQLSDTVTQSNPSQLYVASANWDANSGNYVWSTNTTPAYVAPATGTVPGTNVLSVTDGGGNNLIVVFDLPIDASAFSADAMNETPQGLSDFVGQLTDTTIQFGSAAWTSPMTGEGWNLTSQPSYVNPGQSGTIA